MKYFFLTSVIRKSKINNYLGINNIRAARLSIALLFDENFRKKQ